MLSRPVFPGPLVRMLWRGYRPASITFQGPVSPRWQIRPPSGPEWLHEIKFDG